jgi:ubiquinone/menaquinone biosynthesis C-methylase UbiE
MSLLEAFWKNRLVAAIFENAQVTAWWKRVYENLVDAAASSDPLGALTSDALDVGCGEGLGTRVLADRFRRTVGVDISANMIRRARRHADQAGLSNAEYIEADIRCLPFPDHSFDLVTSTSLVYLLPDPVGALREMARVCRPGGRVASFDPAKDLTLRRAVAAIAAGEVRGHASARAALFLIGWAAASRLGRRFSREEVLTLLASAGLQPVLVEPRCRGMVLFTIATPASAAGDL